MDYQYLNDRTLKITLSFEDLEDHEIRLIDFIEDQERVEELFYDLVEELELDARWEETPVISFQIRPHGKGLDLIVSDDINGFNNIDEGMGDMPMDADVADELEAFLRGASGDENFTLPSRGGGNGNNSEQSTSLALEQLTGDSETKLRKTDAEIAAELAKMKAAPLIYYTVKFTDFELLIKLAKTITTDGIDESELFRYQGDYYLTIMENQEARGVEHTWTLRGLILEYGEQAQISRDVLLEHADPLLEKDALGVLEKI